MIDEMIVTDRRRRSFLAAGLACVVLTSCSSGSDAEVRSDFEPDAVWDFRQPIDGTDIGSTLPELHVINDDDAKILIILPSGKEIEVDGGGASAGRSPVSPPGPINGFGYSVLEGGDADDLRRAAQQLTDDWGSLTATRSNDDSTLLDVADAATLDIEATLGDGENTMRGIPRRRFSGVVGEETIVGVSVTVDRDERYVVVVSVDFEPAIAADA